MKISVAAILLAAASIAEAQWLPVPWVDNGVSAFTNAPVRKDITTMCQVDGNGNVSNEECILFLLAIRAWQATAASQTSSYYQVCGIHGAPHAYWDNSGNFQSNTRQGSGNMGYCFHDTQSFYLWHRPYLTLFEQQIGNQARSIASSWNSGQRSTYQRFAGTLRLPYWDWAAGTAPGTVPTIISRSQLTVRNPNNNQPLLINNPLYRHQLVTGPNTPLQGSISVGTGTTRGITWRASNYQTMMARQGPQLQRWVAQLLTSPNVCWNIFATYDSNERRTCGGDTSVQSLEGIHNSVHNSVSGTMADLNTAAYDPIFWLHHCNVDRIGALWQAANPNTRVVSTRASSGNYVWNGGVNRGDDFQLMPFRWNNVGGNWWQPKWLYNTRNVGYTYPELQDNPNVNTVLSRVRRLYGTGFSQLAVAQDASNKRRVKRNERHALLRYRQAVSANAAELTTAPPADALAAKTDTIIANNGSFNEYDVQITVKKSIATESFNCHLFFGDVDKGLSHADYLDAPNRAGGFAVSLASGMPMGDATAEGIIPVTDALLHMLLIGNIKDMEPSTVRKYLRSKLVWRIVTTSGTDIGGRARGNKLIKMKINHSLVTPPKNPDAKPVVEAPTQIVDVTDNTKASALPSGVAATTVVPVPGAAQTGAGPVPITGDPEP